MRILACERSRALTQDDDLVQLAPLFDKTIII